MTKSSKGRIAYFDALKCFAIFLVLWGHSISQLSTAEGYDNIMFLLISSFHMPLFMAMVGFFASSSLKRKAGELISGKFRQLILPTLIWGVLFYAISCVIGIEVFRFSFIKDLVMNLWFLKSAFLCYLIFYFSFRCCKQRYMAVILSLVISQILPAFKVNYMYPCFLGGYFIRLYLPLIGKKWRMLMPLSLVVYMVLFLTIPESYYHNTTAIKAQLISGDFSAIGELVWSIGARIVMGLSATLFFILLFEKGEWYWQTTLSVVSRWGQMTMIVYILQSFILETIIAHYFKIDDRGGMIFTLVITPVISLLLLILCVWIGRQIQKRGGLAKWLLGTA